MLIGSECLAENTAAPWVGIDLKGLPCNGRHQGVGPFDYIKTNHSEFKIVEEYHFTEVVENLISGQSGYLVGDLFYTLGAVPNHHRALFSLIRYQLNLNNHLSNKNSNTQLPTPVECVFFRAMKFSPTDAGTLSLFAYYLRNISQLEKASKYYLAAIEIDPENSKIHYSYSLLLIEMKDYDNALIYAKKAYQLGKPPKSLKQKLEKLGIWK